MSSSHRLSRKGRRGPARGPNRRTRGLLLEQLEERRLLALLGLAQQAVNPDIASGIVNDLSYTQVGNNANPFHYDSIPFALTLPGGSMMVIGDPTGNLATTSLDLVLNNAGKLVPGNNPFSVTGMVSVGANNYNGTLLTAQAQAFGFADTITPMEGEFDVRMVVTGGLLTGAGGPYHVGDNLGLLLHQPGLTISSFPQTFSFSTMASGLFIGDSDTKVVPPPDMRLERPPMPSRPPTNDSVSGGGGGGGGSSSTGCGCGGGGGGGGTGISSGYSQNSGSAADLYDGSADYVYLGEDIASRGFDFMPTITYRSDVNDNGPLGHNWELNYDARLEQITPQNLAEFQAVFPNAKVGDVDKIDGNNRDDLYVQNPDGSFTSPAGYYTNLVRNPDGSYTERYQDGTVDMYRAPDSMAVATMSSMTDRQGNTTRFQYDANEQLTFVTDTLGRPIEFFYDSQAHLTEIRDFENRSTRFTYDANGDLTSITTPIVTGTPNGNDFPNGQTTRFTYSSGFADPRLNHELLTVTAPNEVADGGPPRLRYTYDTNAASPTAGRVTSLADGGTDQNGLPAGGTISYQYQTLGPAMPGDFTTPVSQTTATDRNGNITQYQYNQLNNTVDVKQFNNRNVRPGDPAFYETKYQYDGNYRLLQVTMPLGNKTTYTYDSANSDRFQQGNLLSITQTPDAARGGDQSAITTTFTYEPIYNQLHTTTEARGNDPTYVPQNGGANTPGRYTTTYTYDYQEGTNFAALGAILGVSPATAAARLATAGIPMGLGDVNGDGRTDQTMGNLVRLQSPTVHLLPGSNQASVEGTTLQPIVTTYVYNDFGQMTRSTDPELNVTTYTYFPERTPNGGPVIGNPNGDATTGGYLKQTIQDASSAPGRDSGTNPTPAAIRTTYQYDNVGNATRMIDGRGIATDYVYNQLNQVVQTTRASAHGLYGADPNELMPLTDFQYLERTFYDFNGNVVLRQVEDRGNTSNVRGNPPAADLPTLGIRVASTSTDVNTLTTLNDTTQAFTTNQWAGFAVKIISGTGVGQVRVIASNSATQLVVTAPWTTTPDASSHYVIYPLLNADPANGTTAFQDTVYKYDILDHRAEMRQEVTNGASPEFLRTRYRYDPDGNQVLTIQPEGNSTSAIYDERNLAFRTFRGLASPPPLVLLEPGDPTNYDVRGGAPCFCTSYRYDFNGNVIETVDSDDTDLSPANNDPTLGPGDRTRYIYDGFDRRTSMVDAVGNQSVTQYDPAGEVIRTSQFGPTGGASPTADGPSVLPMPVSSLGVIQSGNLVNSNLLASTEASYDELGRSIQTNRVLFVNTIPTTRTPDVAEGGSDVGLGNLNPGQTQAIPGLSGVTIIGRVADRTEYDRNSRTTFTVQDDLNTARTFYDGVGRTIETIDPQGNTVETAYDANSNVIETRETDVSQVPGVANEIFLTTSFYDSLNRRQETVDNLGQTSQSRYDSRGNLVAMADAQGPADGTLVRRSFPNGPRTVNTTNTFGNVTLYFYDGLNRQVRQDQILTATHQGDGTHIGASLFGIKNDPTAPESFTPTPDPTQGGGDGIIRTGFTYDQNSLSSAMIDDQGNVTVYLYDNMNRKVAETAGMTINSTYTATNILGPRVIPTPTAATINNPNTVPTSQINTQLTEAQGRVAAIAGLFPSLANRVDDHPPTTKVWGYDPDNNVLIYQDENGSETFTKYDAINRPIARRIFRAGQTDSFAGDPVFAPAPVNPIPTNPSKDDEPGATIIGTTKQDYQYDGLSRMTRATDNNDPTTAADDSTVTDAYDSLSRVIEEAQTIGGQPTKIISSAWRADALRSKLTYPNARAEVYTYDHLDRLKTVSDQGAALPIAQYDYIGAGRVLDRLYPLNGTRETYLDNANTTDVGYDGLRRPVQMRDLRSDNSLIVGFTYTYDRMNNKLTEGKLHDAKNSETYTYDSAYRLLTFNRAAGGITPGQSTWKLDGAGNWTQVDNETRQHSSFNEITTRTVGATTTNLRYDDSGNELDDGTFLYTYDAMNRMRTVTRKSDSAPIAVYSYDAMNRRIQKVVTNSGALNGTTTYQYDGWRTLEERTGADVLTQQYVYGIYLDEGLVLDRNLNADGTATGPGDQRLFYEQNTLYNVYALTDVTGKILEGYQYDAYGRQTVFAPGVNGLVDFGGDDVITQGGSSNVANPSLFTGQRLDSETGLYYYKNRYYEPTQGRFLQRDLLGPVDSVNLYAYAQNDPISVADPSGLVVIDTKFGLWHRVAESMYAEKDLSKPYAKSIVSFSFTCDQAGNVLLNGARAPGVGTESGHYQNWLRGTTRVLRKSATPNTNCAGGKGGYEVDVAFTSIYQRPAGAVIVGGTTKGGSIGKYFGGWYGAMIGGLIGATVATTAVAEDMINFPEWNALAKVEYQVCCCCPGQNGVSVTKVSGSATTDTSRTSTGVVQDIYLCGALHSRETYSFNMNPAYVIAGIEKGFEQFRISTRYGAGQITWSPPGK